MSYTVKGTHIRHNGTLYEPGSTIPKSKMDEKTAKYHADAGRLELGKGSSETDETDPKKELLDKNKSHTENLCKEAGYPEEEWGELNKEPLIDYYLDKQSQEDSK